MDTQTYISNKKAQRKRSGIKNKIDRKSDIIMSELGLKNERDKSNAKYLLMRELDKRITYLLEDEEEDILNEINESL